ncbi:MAG TPA: L-rhamnose/proton symporter RhaT [Acidobacteriaceae bacterium]|jgi:L-rhamnose-H+ transport protein
MMQNTSGGLLLLLVAGVMNASFAVPMKRTRGWSWENTWVAWSVFALLALPMVLAFSLVPDYWSLLLSAEHIVVLVAVCGAAWGVAQVLFGLALEKIGIALTFSIVLGLSAAMGSIIPLLRFHRDELFTHAGLVSIAGIVLVLIGVAVCAVAGRMRDRGRTGGQSSPGFGPGLLMAIASGICASMMNVGFAFGGPLSDAAAMRGTGSLWLSDAIWAPMLVGGAIPNVLYCLFLLRKNRTAGQFAANTGRNLTLAFTMAVLWFGSSILYGVSTIYLGTLGKVVGWPLFMSLIVILAGVLGVITGEWKGSDPRALRVQGIATVILICAVIVLSRATL